MSKVELIEEGLNFVLIRGGSQRGHEISFVVNLVYKPIRWLQLPFEQIEKGAIGDIAAKLGVGQGEAGGMLAQMLPGLIDQLTPQGQAPEGGLGGTADLMGMLGKMLQK